MAMKVEAGKKIKIDYELKLDAGQVLESSSARGPLEYVHGSGQMIPALEQRMEQMEVGEERTGVIPAAEIYGEDPTNTRVVKRDEFPAEENVEVGRSFEAKDTDGNPLRFRVVKIDGDQVTIAFQGKDVHYRVKVLAVDDPD
jgi:FKBP-type peptidyl-prolyl cis-trans isomerase SlyD